MSSDMQINPVDQVGTGQVGTFRRLTTTLDQAFLAHRAGKLMRAGLVDLVPREVTVHLFRPSQKRSLEILAPRNSLQVRRQNAKSIPAMMNLIRDLDDLHSCGSFARTQRSTLRQLRSHFVPHASNVDQLRSDLTLSLDSGHRLYALLHASSNETLADQSYFLLCLCRLLSKIDKYASDDEFASYLLDENTSNTGWKATHLATGAGCLVSAGLYFYLNRRREP